MRRYRIQLLNDGIWETKYTINENIIYSNTSAEWSLINLVFTESNYGIKLTYDQIETAQCDMSFSNVSITHSVY